MSADMRAAGYTLASFYPTARSARAYAWRLRRQPAVKVSIRACDRRGFDRSGELVPVGGQVFQVWTAPTRLGGQV